MKKIIVYIKGIILGFVGLAVPGLSAATVALEVGIYQPMIEAISNIFKKFKSSIIFLIFELLNHINLFLLDKPLLCQFYNIMEIRYLWGIALVILPTLQI